MFELKAFWFNAQGIFHSITLFPNAKSNTKLLPNSIFSDYNQKEHV